MPPSSTPKENQSTVSVMTSYFKLVFLLSSPLYLLTALAGFNILGPPDLCGLYITLATGVPCLAASILTSRQGGVTKRRQLYSKCFQVNKEKLQWCVVALLLGPLLYAISYGMVLSTVQNKDDIPPALIPFNLMTFPVVFLLLAIMASGEEMGWMGYAFEPIKRHYGDNALAAAWRLGIVWACWHVPFLVFLFPPPLLLTIPCQVLILIANRILCIWLYQNSSVLAVILFHASDNAVLVLPELKGVYSIAPCITFVVTALMVILLYDSQTLTRMRCYAQEKQA